MKYATIEWRDNQPYSPDFDDIYYSIAGSRGEAEHVFLKSNNLTDRFQDDGQFIIAETGFGFGLNFILTLQAWQQHAKKDACLHYIGIEKHPVSPDDIRRLSKHWPDLVIYFDELLAVYPVPIAGHHTRSLLSGRVFLHFIFMDVLDALRDDRFNVDAWYLDGFSPQKNTDLWSEQVFGLIAQNSKHNATLSTYTSAGSVKRGLVAAGFGINKVKGHGNKREMITAVLENKKPYRTKAPWFEVVPHVPKNKTALVVGAGLAGLSVAWALTQRGWKVTIVDKCQGVARQASGNPAGLVLPRLSIDNKTDSMFYTSAFLYAISQLDRLQSLTDEQFWFKDGVYSLLEKEKAAKIISENGFPCEFVNLISSDDVPKALSDWSGDSVFFPEAGWAIPPKICTAIARAAVDRIEQVFAEVGDLARENNCWVAKDKNGEVVASADIAIIAAGDEINTLGVTSWLPVFSARGQVTRVPANENSRDFTSAVSFDGYVTPVHNGEHITGASYSTGDNDKNLNAQHQRENIDRLNHYIPDLFMQPDRLEGRVGFRAVSEDRVPIVGAVPDRDAFLRLYMDLHHGRTSVYYEKGEYLQGLYVSAAHGSRGMCSCFLSAEIVACMVEGELLPVSKGVSDYINPARFIIRQLKRNRPIDK